MVSKEKARPRLIVIAGPTCVGKTEMALKMAAIWKAEIISADSMQVYRYMDIGTAKPEKVQRAMTPHHLIDVADPHEPFNAAMYADLAREIVERTGGESKIFFVAGGTGLYIKALLGGIFSGPPADDGLRAYYRELLKRSGTAYLYGLLKEKDEKAAAAIDSNNPARIIRAIEVWELTGKSIVDQQQAHHFGNRPYDYLKIGLRMDRKLLWERIGERTQAMIRGGLVDEVNGLLAQGYHEGLKSMQSLGYRHIARYLSGDCTLEDAASFITRDTRRYAKRQMTWFVADDEMEWFDFDDAVSINKRIQTFLACARTYETP